MSETNETNEARFERTARVTDESYEKVGILNEGHSQMPDLPAEPPVKKRTRRTKEELAAAGYERGSSKPRAETPATRAKKLATQLAGIHQGIAMFTHNPIWALSDVEAGVLGQSVSDVLDLYQVKASPAFLAWIGLAGVSLTIYGPRLALVLAEKQSKKRPVAPVVNIRPEHRQAAASAVAGEFEGMPIG